MNFIYPQAKACGNSIDFYQSITTVAYIIAAAASGVQYTRHYASLTATHQSKSGQTIWNARKCAGVGCVKGKEFNFTEWKKKNCA